MAGGRERARASSSASVRGSASASPSSASASASASSAPPDAPVRVFPPSSAAARALQALQAEGPGGVAAIGILSSGRVSAAFALANRVIGRRAFHGDELDDAVLSPRRGTSPAKRPVHASIHLYYDASRRCVYLLGLAHPVATVGSSFTSDGDALLPQEMAEAERERLKMRTLLFTSCSLVFVLQWSARTSTHEIKRLRALATEKAQLVQWMGAAGSTGGKSGGKRSSSSSATQVFAPGRCVPVAVFVVPAASDSMLSATIKARPGVSATGGPSTTTRSATAAHGKAIEARLMALFRSLRGGPVASARMRDALTAANLSKERRVFTMDPSHSVVVISRRALDGPEVRLRDVLDALTDSETESEAESAEEDELLGPLEDDDVGWPRAVQYQQRLLDHLHALQASGGGAKDAPGVRMELLPLAQWFKTFQSLAKLYQRMDSKRRSESVGGSAVPTDGE